MFAVTDNEDFLIKGDIHGTREKTLAMILPLLQEGKLKVGRWEKGSIFKEITGTPEDIVSTISTGWKEADEDKTYSAAAYEIDVKFTLPENEWNV